MFRQVSIGLISLAGALALNHGAADAAAPAHSPQAAAKMAAECVTSYGTQDSRRTFTEHFTSNCASLRVRLKVVCHDNFDGEDSNDYGGELRGTGTSTYRCNSIESIKKGTGHGQYFNFQKWVDLPH